MRNQTSCLKNFYVRIPYHSYNFYKNELNNISMVEQEKYLKKVKEKEGEIICSASKSLYESLDDCKQDVEKKYISSLKYQIRSSTRTTPYGLLSGVAKGKFANEENFNIGNFKKKADVDLEWLLNIAKECEKKVGDKLNVCFNNSLIYHNDRIYKIWASCYSEEKNDIDIKNTNAIKRLLNFCPYGVYKKVEDIYEYLKKEYNTENTSIFNTFIKELLKNEILISDFRIPTVNANQLQYLLNRLMNYGLKKDYNQLNSIKNKLDLYNTMEINSTESIKMYYELIDEMNKLYECNNYIKYDMYFDEEIKYPSNEKKNITNFYNFLNKFDNGKYMYSNYYNLFIDKYGYSCVKYLDVVDPIVGIGYPVKDQAEKNTSNYKKLFNLLYKNINNSVDLSVLEDELKLSDLEISDAELSFYIQKVGDKFKYICSPLGGSNMIGKSFGRFAYLFNSENCLNSDDNDKRIEVSFLPNEERITNVLSCESKSSNIIELSLYSDTNKKHVNLADIYVFPENGKLYFYNIKTNMVVDFISTNMTNTQFFPKILNTLIYLTEAKYNDPFTLFRYINEFYSNSLYRPEIRYKNFIISAEQWKVGSELFKYINNYELFLNEFNVLREENNINNHVYAGNGDNYLLLNLNNKIHIKILYEMIKQEKVVNLINYKLSIDNLILLKRESKYLAEFVFQIKSSFYNEKHTMNLPKYDLNSAKKNTLLSFDECIYMKIFSKKSDQDYLLVSYIKPFIEFLYEKNLINKCFFIRYKDDGDHIRLRLFYNEKNNSLLLNEIMKFQKDIYSSGIISSISFYPYEREYLRYGGEENIKYFEEYFSAESYDILQYLNEKNILSKELLYVSSCILTLKNLNISLDESLRLLKVFKLDKKDKKDLQQFKQDNKTLIDGLFGRYDSKLKEDIYKLVCTEKSEQKFKEKIDLGDFEKFNLDDILLSLFHMRFNRLIGIDRQYENKLMSYIENILYTEERRKFYACKK